MDVQYIWLFLNAAQSGLDLSVLLSTLVPPAMVVESDTPWTFESLLRVRVTEINLNIIFELNDF